jgi:ribosomal protein S18 acetylase RimI-like enzyme
MIAVEKATEQDIDSLLMLDHRTTSTSSRINIITEAIKAGQCFINKKNDNITGFGVLEYTFFGQGLIGLLIVGSEYRRRGIASAIIRYIESICKTKKLFTSTNESNIIAQKVYESLGFIRSGYIENLDEGDPEIVYFKQLE